MQRCLSFSLSPPLRFFSSLLYTILSILSRVTPPILSSLSLSREIQPARARSRSAALRAVSVGQLSQRIDRPNVIGNWHLQGDRNWFSEMQISHRIGLLLEKWRKCWIIWSCRIENDRSACSPGFACYKLVPDIIANRFASFFKFSGRYQCRSYTIAHCSRLKLKSLTCNLRVSIEINLRNPSFFATSLNISFIR